MTWTITDLSNGTSNDGRNVKLKPGENSQHGHIMEMNKNMEEKNKNKNKKMDIHTTATTTTNRKVKALQKKGNTNMKRKATDDLNDTYIQAKEKYETQEKDNSNNIELNMEKEENINIHDDLIEKSKKKKSKKQRILDGGLDNFAWSNVKLPEAALFENNEPGGFMCLEEVEGVDVVYEQEPNGGKIIKFVVC